MKNDFNPNEPKAMFNTLMSNEVQLELTQKIYSCYNLAAEYCFDEFPEAEAKDLLPIYRRARIESTLADCLAKFKDNVEVSTKKNDANNSSHRIIVSNRILITQSCVRHKSELPREAAFRRTYARSGQGYLFPDDRPPDPDTSMYLYAIMVHSPSESPKVPEFIDIIFPDENYERCIDRIELLIKFQQVKLSSKNDKIEEIKDSLSLRKLESRLIKERNA